MNSRQSAVSSQQSAVSSQQSAVSSQQSAVSSQQSAVSSQQSAVSILTSLQLLISRWVVWCQFVLGRPFLILPSLAGASCERRYETCPSQFDAAGTRVCFERSRTSSLVMSSLHSMSNIFLTHLESTVSSFFSRFEFRCQVNSVILIHEYDFASSRKKCCVNHNITY